MRDTDIPNLYKLNRRSINKWNPIHSSLYIKLVVILFLVFTITVLGLTYQLERNLEETHLNLVQNELKSIAAIAAVSIDGDVVAGWRKPEQQQTQEYMAIKKFLANFKEANDSIQDIYIMRKGAAERALVFILEIDESEDAAGFNELYDSAGAPDMLTGFERPAVDKEFATDKWGITLSGYAPIKNSQGETVAIVGIDFDAQSIQDGIAERREQMLLYSGIGMLIMLGVSLILAKSIVSRLKQVKVAVDTVLEDEAGTHHYYREKDEVNLLAHRVNRLIKKVAVEKEQILVSIIMTLVNTLEVRDEYTHGHSTEVAVIATDIMTALKIDTEERFMINFAALLHDIGKIGIADTILNKKGKLTEEEFDAIKQHPVMGAKILAGIPSLNQIAEIVKYHHERYDGGGYPNGLSGAEISLGARIIAVADSFQAMISDRPYRKGMSQQAAMEEMERNKGTQFDPEIIEVFLKICQSKNYKQ